jgi:hypothetical protein
MFAKRLAAVVPGIMGSTLSMKGRYIWSKSISDNYKRMSKSPQQLQWTGVAADQVEIWKEVRISKVIPLVKIRLWAKTLAHLQAHPEFEYGNTVECPYDWRDTLQNSAASVVGILQRHTKHPLTGLRPPEAPRFVFLTHSMGGLLLRVAISQQAIHPSFIERIVHMAPPLLGAPVAFRSLVQETTMPLLNELLRYTHMRNYPIFARNMYQVFRTFPSMYELMPPQNIAYILESGMSRTNPLSETYFDGSLVANAISTHSLISAADAILNREGIPVFVIATDFHQKQKTDQEYKVQPLPAPASSYSILETYNSSYGDGTVLSDSATSAAGCKPLRIMDVEHAKMPNSAKAVDLLSNCGV